MRPTPARIVEVVKRTALHAFKDDVTGMAGDLAYRFFLALFPFFIFLTALGTYIASAFHIANPAQKIVSNIGGELPPDVAHLVQNQLQQIIKAQSTGLLSIGIIGTLIAASSGFSALFKAFNRAYGAHESRPLWERYIFAFVLTVLAGTLIAVSFTLLVVGELTGARLLRAIGVPGAYQTVLLFARWGMSIALILAAVILIYRVIPDREIRLVRALPGAALFAVAWAAMTYGFAFYLQQSSSYNATYGALAGAAILLIWFYLTSLLLLIGAELNAVLDGRAAPAVGFLRPRLSPRRPPPADGDATNAEDEQSVASRR